MMTLEGPTGTALALTFGLFADPCAKTAHGLIRGGDRFQIVGLVDSASDTPSLAGRYGDGLTRVFRSVDDALQQLEGRPQYAVIGVAFPGGRLPEHCRAPIVTLLRAGVSLVSGLHELLGEDQEFVAAAAASGASIHDVRRPKRWDELRFWSGDIYSVRAPVVAVLGTDCALGKRTTALLAQQHCQARGLNAQMIYTGQTGWMQGIRHGFIFDSTLNDFVSGELEGAIVRCARETDPDLILLEGQSALRNPTGPCGAEFLLSGNARAVILQAAPARSFFKGTEQIGCALPDVEDEIDLIGRYGSKVLAVTLNGEGTDDTSLRRCRDELEKRLALPVVLPLQSIDPLVDVLEAYARGANSAGIQREAVAAV